MQIRLRKRLGDLLVDENIITQQQLEQALTKQQSTGRKLGDTLINLGFLTEQQMLQFLARQLDVPLVDLTRVQVDSEHVGLLSEVNARRLRALVLGQHGDTVRVAMSDPADLAAQEAVFDQLSQYRVELEPGQPSSARPWPPWLGTGEGLLLAQHVQCTRSGSS